MNSSLIDSSSAVPTPQEFSSVFRYMAQDKMIESYNGLFKLDAMRQNNIRIDLKSGVVEKLLSSFYSDDIDNLMRLLLLVILIEYDLRTVDELMIEINIILEEMEDAIPLDSPESSLFMLHGFYLVNLISDSCNYQGVERRLSNLLIRKRFQEFSSLDHSYFLYFFARLITNFTYLSFQWKNMLDQLVLNTRFENGSLADSILDFTKQMLTLNLQTYKVPQRMPFKQGLSH